MARTEYRRPLVLTVLALAMAALKLGPSVAAGPQPFSCSNAAGTLTVSSAPDSRLTVAVTRADAEIKVGFGSEVPCSGPTPTVDNLDLITIQSAPGVRRDAVFIDLVAGPLAPGATDEGDESPEIEIEVNLGGEQGDAVQLTTPKGQPDHIEIGRRGGVHRVNVNGADERADGDSDLELRNVKRLVVHSSGGSDVISGRGAPDAPRPARIRLGLGTPGSGDDRLIGGDGRDGMLSARNAKTDDVVKGGRGRDSLDAVGGNDKLVGGPGSDTLRAGGGRDRISARDSARDRVECGGGVDRGKADAADRLKACERVRQR